MEARWACFYAGLEDAKWLWRSGRPALYLLIRALLRALPRRAAMLTGRLLGVAAFRVLARYRNMSIRNIRLAFPEREEPWARRVARSSFEGLGCCVAEAARLERAALGEVAGVTRAHGFEQLEGALRSGRGAVLVSAHMGCWELLPAYLASIGLRTALIVRPQAGSSETALLSRERKKLGVTEIVPSIKALRKALEVLSEGGVVICPLDRDGGPNGFCGSFMGKPLRFSSLPVRLAALAGAVVLPARAESAKAGRLLVFGAPAEIGDRSNLEELTATLGRTLEGWIRERPEQWVWLDKH